VLTSVLIYALKRFKNTNLTQSFSSEQTTTLIELESTACQMFQMANVLTVRTEKGALALCCRLRITNRLRVLGAEDRALWLCTAPITQEFLQKATHFQFNTYSNEWEAGDNPLPVRGARSWFDVSIWRADQIERQEQDQLTIFPLEVFPSLKPKIGKNGEVLRWRSHNNTSSRPSWQSGLKFSAAHPLWAHIEVGDTIGVEVCSRVPGLTCESSGVEILIWADGGFGITRASNPSGEDNAIHHIPDPSGSNVLIESSNTPDIVRLQGSSVDRSGSSYVLRHLITALGAWQDSDDP
jgi:hypothetical protein